MGFPSGLRPADMGKLAIKTRTKLLFGSLARLGKQMRLYYR